MASVFTTYALVDLSGRSDQQLSNLSVTRTERAELLRELESNFGAAARRGIQAGQPAVVGAAALLYIIYMFLADQKWKSLEVRTVSEVRIARIGERGAPTC